MAFNLRSMNLEKRFGSVEFIQWCRPVSEFVSCKHLSLNCSDDAPNDEATNEYEIRGGVKW